MADRKSEESEINGLGRQLKRLREEAGLTQGELAKLAGVTRNAVSQWESDTTQPTAKRLALIAKALNVTIDQIMSTDSKVREKIIETATRLFDRLGVADTSIDMVCAAADVEKHEFDSLFETKDALLYSVLSEYNNRTFDEVSRIPPNYGSLEDRIKYLLRMYYANDLDHINLTSALHAYSWQWSEAQERENRRQLSDHHEVVVSLFESAVKSGEIRRGNFRAASQLILAAYTYALRKAVYEKFNADQLISYIEPQLQVILNGFATGQDD